MPQLDRITLQPEVMGGKACIRGMRVTVGMLVGKIGAGVVAGCKRHAEVANGLV
ncbi:hypothetical protein BH09PSE5_BH09PSE5_48280 [soil metagenome]